MVWWDAFLVLDLALDVVDRIARLHLEGDGFAREGLDEAVISISSVSPSGVLTMQQALSEKGETRHWDYRVAYRGGRGYGGDRGAYICTVGLLALSFLKRVVNRAYS